jgi:hypothetical protein
MLIDKNLIKLKIIALIILILSSFLLIFIFLFLKDIPVLSSLLKEYIESGNSFFIPSIPYHNLLCDVPEKFPNAHFTVGHLIDLIIMLNLVSYIESSIYHYIKKIYFTNTKCGYYEFSVFYHKGISSLKNESKNETRDNLLLQNSPSKLSNNSEKTGLSTFYGMKHLQFDDLRRKRKKYYKKNYKLNFNRKISTSINSHDHFNYFFLPSLSNSLWNMHSEYSYTPIFNEYYSNYNLLLKKVVL